MNGRNPASGGRLTMFLSNLARCAVVLSVSIVCAGIAPSFAAEQQQQYRIPAIPGLEVTRGKDIQINGPRGKAIAFRFKDGRICVYGDGARIAYWSHDGGRSWK